MQCSSYRHSAPLDAAARSQEAIAEPAEIDEHRRSECPRRCRHGNGSRRYTDRWNMPLWSKILLITAGVLIALFLLDRLGLWMEARGWIYWRKVKPKGGGVAAGLSAFRELVEPQVRHVAEDRERRKIEIHRDDRTGPR
jgi:hypothetical protein